MMSLQHSKNTLKGWDLNYFKIINGFSVMLNLVHLKNVFHTRSFVVHKMGLLELKLMIHF